MEVNGIAEATEEQNKVDKKGVNVTSSSGCFDCNICLDFAVDPVVTLCGHLYCWPCIYKWLQVDDTSSSSQCPVCKSSLSEDALVPLYGRGHTTKHSHQSVEIPRRPSSRHHQDQTVPESAGISRSAEEEDLYRHRHQHYHLHQHEHHHHHPLATMGSTRMIHSTAGGVHGGMAIAVLPWVLRNNRREEAMSVRYSSPLSVGANGNSPRLRRQEMEVEMSLHQIWLFLFCCALLCLLLF